MAAAAAARVTAAAEAAIPAAVAGERWTAAAAAAASSTKAFADVNAATGIVSNSSTRSGFVDYDFGPSGADSDGDGVFDFEDICTGFR